jgi:hypothetical protein
MPDDHDAYEDHGFSGREPSRGGYDDHGSGRGDYRDRSYLSRGFFRDRGAPDHGPHGRYEDDDLPDRVEGGGTRRGEFDEQADGDERPRRHAHREVQLEPHAPAAGGWNGDVRGALGGAFRDAGGGAVDYAGVGPKGWLRSDDRIREEICEILTRHPAIDPSDVEVEVKEGVVRLVGTVGDRAAKWLAEDIAEGSFGVRGVINDIRVRRAD